MSDFCQITVVGRLTRDTETKKVGEHTVTKASIAYSTGYGDKKKSSFLDISAWNKTGDALARLAKGDPVMVVGQLVQESWEREGQKRTAHKMEVQQVVYISAKKDSADAGLSRTAPSSAATVFGGAGIEDAPFAAEFGNW